MVEFHIVGLSQVFQLRQGVHIGAHIGFVAGESLLAGVGSVSGETAFIPEYHGHNKKSRQDDCGEYHPV